MPAANVEAVDVLPVKPVRPPDGLGRQIALVRRDEQVHVAGDQAAALDAQPNGKSRQVTVPLLKSSFQRGLGAQRAHYSNAQASAPGLVPFSPTPCRLPFNPCR